MHSRPILTFSPNVVRQGLAVGSLMAWLALAPSLSASALPSYHPPALPPDAASPSLVFDESGESANQGLPRNYRNLSDPLDADHASLEAKGLAGLRASGSAQSSLAGLSAIAARAKGSVWIVDLRQEDHLFLNNQPHSWYATNNWSNLGKSPSEAAASEFARLALVSGLPTLAVRSSDDLKRKAKTSSVETPATSMPSATQSTPATSLQVRSFETEEQACARLGLGYQRLRVSDHCRPTDEVVDAFVAFERSLPADAWLHFHCRAGRGRTTTFMALHDMLHNATELGFEAICARQAALAGDYDLTGVKEDKGDKARLVAERNALLRAFYDYVREARPLSTGTAWTTWLHQKEATP